MRLCIRTNVVLQIRHQKYTVKHSRIPPLPFWKERGKDKSVTQSTLSQLVTFFFFMEKDDF